MYGFGYRRWCKISQCSDVRLHGIVKVAATGIKAIIHEELERKQDVMEQMNVIQTQTVANEAIVPQVPIQENIVETPRAQSSEVDVPEPEVEDSEVVPCDGQPQIAEKLIAGPRVLKVHHSEVSTCAPSCLHEEQESAMSDTASCGDTEVCEPERRRRHPRRPRTGRRARARERQERWGAAMAEAGLEARGMLSDSQVGAFLACIAEDDSDEERRLRSGGVGADPESESEEGNQTAVAGAREGVKGVPECPVSAEPALLSSSRSPCAGDDYDHEEMEQAAPKRARRETGHAMPGLASSETAHAGGLCSRSSQSLPPEEGDGSGAEKGDEMPGPTCCASNRAGERGPSSSLINSSEEEETTDECSDMDEDDVEELAGWTDHDSWQEMDEGAKVLPAKLVLAMMHLQTTALGWQARFGFEDFHAWPVEQCKLMIVDAARELEPKFRRVRAVVRHLATNWKSPVHLNSHWSALLEWLEDGEDGPCWQHRRLKKLLDELDDSRYFGEFGSECLQEEASIRGRSLREGWHQFQWYVDRLGAVQRGRLRRDQECAEQMNARLAKSVAGRALP